MKDKAMFEELILKKESRLRRSFEGRSTINSDGQVGIKSENINEWQKSYKHFQIIVNAIVVGHSSWYIALRWLELSSDQIEPLLCE